MSARKDLREQDVMMYRDFIYGVIYMYLRRICAGNSSQDMQEEAIQGSKVIGSVVYDRLLMDHI